MLASLLSTASLPHGEALQQLRVWLQIVNVLLLLHLLRRLSSLATLLKALPRSGSDAAAVTAAAAAAAATAAAAAATAAGEHLVPRVHLRSVPPLPLQDADQREALAALRETVRKSVARAGISLGEDEEAVLDDDLACCRYLVARGWAVPPAADMLHAALLWRVRRSPPGPLCDLDSADGAFLRLEGGRGKVYVPDGVDCHGRGVLVLDNSVQRSGSSLQASMRYFAFCIQLALRQAELARARGGGEGGAPAPGLQAPPPDKLLIVIKLQRFSLLNSPPPSHAKETLEMLMNHFPESAGLAVACPRRASSPLPRGVSSLSLGHIIVYRPPRVFSGLWAFSAKLIDAKMRSKVHFISGSVADGSANDALMRRLAGDGWKQLCGCEQPFVSPGCTEGFEPDSYWRGVVQRDRAWSALRGPKPTKGST